MPDGSFPIFDEQRSQGVPFSLGNFSIDEYRPIKVIVIGAGFSGILAGIRFPQKIPNVDIVIYEKSAGVGGTWFNSKYPGIACDVPAHCYQYSFEDKRDWSSFYAPGSEIQQHLQEVAEKYKAMRYIKLNHEVVHAQYDEANGKWHVRVRRLNPDTNESEEFEDVGDVLFAAFGAVGRWNWPDIEGLKDFKGELYHTAEFNPPEGSWEKASENWKDKKVGVIGVGASAIQVVPAIQPTVQKLFNYVRGKTWLSLPIANDLLLRLLGRDSIALEDSFDFSPEEIERFKTDEAYYKQFRHEVEAELNSVVSYTLNGASRNDELRELLAKHMKEKVAKKPWIAEKITPEFPVACRRLTPGPGYLEALCADNAEFVDSSIKRLTETGIETVDGKHQELDIVLCATGYDVSWQLPFKIVGRNGVDINDKFKPYPLAYLGVCVDGFPNMFMSLGPNSMIGEGFLVPIIESAVSYAVQATSKLQRERLKSVEIKKGAVKAFDDYIQSYFPQSVFSHKCPSWYRLDKEEGRIVALWPGTGLHAQRALRNPRWEDYDYERLDAEGNSLFWLGDGQTWNEKTLTGDRAWYLSDEYVDKPAIPRD